MSETRYKGVGYHLETGVLTFGIIVTVFIAGAMIRENTITLPDSLMIKLEMPPNTEVLPVTSMGHLYPPSAEKKWLPKNEFMKFASRSEKEITFLRYYEDKTGPPEKFTLYYWVPVGDGTIYYTELDIPLRWRSIFEIDRITRVGEVLYVSPRYGGVLAELRSFI